MLAVSGVCAGDVHSGGEHTFECAGGEGNVVGVVFLIELGGLLRGGDAIDNDAAHVPGLAGEDFIDIVFSAACATEDSREQYIYNNMCMFHFMLIV